MLQAMFSGVSGLQVHQTKLDVIGNNISNVNTIGFKSGNVSFEDQLSQTLRASSSPTGASGGQNPAQVGLGVQLGAVDTNQAQGNLESTGQLTDMAIQGNGFFMVGTGQNVSYTRDGSFNLDSDGILVNPANGNELLGYVADSSGNIDTTQPITSTSTLKIPIGLATSVKQTDAATFQGNLDAGASLVSTATTLSGNLATDPTTVSTTAYDGNGNAHTVNMTFSGKSSSGGNDTWNVSMLIDGATVPGAYTATFNTATGAYVSTTVPPQTTVTGSNGASNFVLGLDLSSMSDLPKLTASSSANNSTAFAGNLTTDPTTVSTTVSDGSGGTYPVSLTLSGETTGTDPTTGNLINTWNATMTVNGTPVAGTYKMTFDATTGNQLSSTVPASTTTGGETAAIDVSGIKNIPNQTATTDGQTGSSPTLSASLKVYDSLGQSHQVNVSFTRSLVGTGAPAGAVGEWNWTATENGKIVGGSNNSGSNPLYFNNSGNLIDQAKQNITLTGGASPISIDFSTLTQLAGTSSVASNTQDGFPVGTLQSFTISQAGLITGVFSNGQSRSLGQIAMASFANPAGLLQDGQNLFSESSNSGQAQVGVPGSQNRGNINTGYVEMSNVDLSTEFTDLIVTQRGFQANTKIISTVDELLQTVIAMKQ